MLYINSNWVIAQNDSIHANCASDFTYEVNYAVEPLLPAIAINFYDRSKGDTLNYYWDFGDGYTSTEKNPMHLFSKVRPVSNMPWESHPIAKVCHSVFNYSCNDTNCKFIPLWADSTMPTLCTATIDFKEISDSGLFKKFQFYGTSPNKVAKWFWDFGNGVSSTEQNPVQSFQGIYVGYTKPLYGKNVFLTVTTSDSCVSTISTFIDLTIWGPYPDSGTCNVSFNYSVDSIFDNNSKAEVRFSAASGPIPLMYPSFSYNIIQWHWDFGDGTKSTDSLPVHTYDKSIINCNCDTDYVVILNAVNNSGCTATYTQQISPFKTTSDCQVYYTYYRIDSMNNNPDKVTLQFSSINAKNSEIMTPEKELVSWKWDFGDSTYSEEANPAHTFIIPKIECFNGKCAIPFNVCLTAVNASGCVANYCSLVYPGGGNQSTCQANFSYTKSDSIPPVYNFRNISAWNGGSSFWSFGDGEFSNELNPSHTFKSITYYPVIDTVYANNKKSMGLDTGNYLPYYVCLSISDSTGCSSTYCETINVSSGNPGSLCNHLVKLSTSIILGSNDCSGTAWAELVDYSGNPVKASAYYWSNGETTPSASNICTNTTYSVSITDYLGCTTANSFAIEDYTNPQPYYGDWSYDHKDSIYLFKYMSNDPAYIAQWHFSDGKNINGINITHSFPNDSDNWVELIITDGNGNVIRDEIIRLPSKTTGIHQIANNIIINLFPNPASDVLNVKLSGSPGNVSIEIIDMIGRLRAYSILNKGQLQGKINLDNLQKGIYICRIRTKNEILLTNKIIIQ